MNSIFKLGIAGALLWVAPCLAASSSAKNDFDPEIDFTRFKTFCFVGGHELEKTGILADPVVRDRIKNFISGSLETRKLKEVPKDEKYSLAVRYWIALRQKQDVTVYSYGMGGYPGYWGGYPAYWTGAWGYSYEEYVIQNYVEGTLVVDLIDPLTKELVWRTFLRQRIEDRAEAYDQAKKNLYKAMLTLPPSNDEKQKMRKARAKLAAKYK